MNGMSRFLSRREKRRGRSQNRQSYSEPTNVYDIFTSDSLKRGDKKEDEKVKTITQRLDDAGLVNFQESQVEYALRVKSSHGDAERAFELLKIFEDSVNGEVKEYDPSVKLVGAENREYVTCYLDALLFAMFARLDSFDSIIVDHFSDEPSKRLAFLLRLWVNMVRNGRLVTVDITRHLQYALKACGWDDAAELHQQDASEAFTFLTDKLGLPLLTLKMDIYHVGKENKEDDHKIIKERLLEVSIPEPPEGSKVVTLEECLEAYFNNRIEVKRHLQRRNTVQSVRSFEQGKGQTVHVESVELSGPETPTVSTPTSTVTPAWPKRPIDGRRRADSIFSERFVSVSPSSESKVDESAPVLARSRGSSIRKEVMMPAWQFFSLIPWYTEDAPKNDAQVAAHFSRKRPILGICLKRYSMLPDGKPKRLDTYIDIPPEIALPHFVSNDQLEQESPLFSNFKLSLQSVVCHRGVSVDSGHYISLVRANGSNEINLPLPSNQKPTSAGKSGDKSLEWLQFDDLATERVTAVDIKSALKKESPYLLFYQVQPIEEDQAPKDIPPPYSEEDLPHRSSAPVVNQSEISNMDPIHLKEARSSPTKSTHSHDDGKLSNIEDGGPTEDCTTLRGDSVTSTTTASAAAAGPTLESEPKERTSIGSNRRSTIMFDNSSLPFPSPGGNTGSTTPLEEAKAFFTESRRGSKAFRRENLGSKSRQSSQSGENRFAAFLTIAGRKSRDKLSQSSETDVTDEQAVIVEPADHEEQKEGDKSGLDRVKSKSKKDKVIRALSQSKSGNGDEGLGNKTPHEKRSKPHKKPPDRECNIM